MLKVVPIILSLCAGIAQATPATYVVGQIHAAMGSLPDVWMQFEPTGDITYSDYPGGTEFRQGPGGLFRMYSGSDLLMDGEIIYGVSGVIPSDQPLSIDWQYYGLVTAQFAAALDFDGSCWVKGIGGWGGEYPSTPATAGTNYFVTFDHRTPASAAPEPGTFFVMGSGLLLVLFFSRTEAASFKCKNYLS